MITTLAAGTYRKDDMRTSRGVGAVSCHLEGSGSIQEWLGRMWRSDCKETCACPWSSLGSMHSWHGVSVDRSHNPEDVMQGNAEISSVVS